MKRWQKQVKDKGFTAEGDLLKEMWPNYEQPITSKPNFYANKNNEIVIECETKGASIAYQITEKGKQAQPDWKYWNVYSKPISVKKNEELHTIAIRIGYKHSEVSTY